MALSTRPSQVSVGRTAARTPETNARQPRRTPSSVANGISSACPPENPTTSQGIGPAGVSITTRAPTDIACSGPDTPTITQRTPTPRRRGPRPRPPAHQAADPDHPAVNLRTVEFFDVLEQRPHKRWPFGNVSALALTACLPASLIITSPSLGLRRHSSRQDGWMSRKSRLDPTLHVELERDRGEKTTL